MLIVPNEDVLIIEVRISPADIRSRVGQAAILRFPAFNQGTTPEMARRVSQVAADLTREAASAQAATRTRGRQTQPHGYGVADPSIA